MKMEMRTKMVEAGINWETGLERFVGNDSLFIAFLKKFPGDSSYSKMAEELEKNNCEEAFKAAHTLKGVAGNLSLEDLYHKLQPLVEALRDGKLEEGKEYFETVEESYERTIRAIMQL